MNPLPQTKERHTEYMRDYREQKKQEKEIKQAVAGVKSMTASFTEREMCMISAVHFLGLSNEVANIECGECNDSEKKLYRIDQGGIVEVESEEEPQSMETTVRFVGKGVDYEQMFIKQQIKNGDTREHAEKLAQGIMAFVEDVPVVDSKGNASVEAKFYFSHDPQGQKEFHPIKKINPVKPTPYTECMKQLWYFRTAFPLLADAKVREECATKIMYGPERIISPLTLRLREVLNAGASHAYMNVMTRWLLERQKINEAAQKREQEQRLKKSPFDHSDRNTVGSSYGLPETEKAEWKGTAGYPKELKEFEKKHDVQELGKGETGFRLRNRKTIGTSYGMTKKQKERWLRGEKPEETESK